MLQRFLKDTSGSIAPIFMVAAPFLVAFIGVGIDYSRVLAHKGKLQSLTDQAVTIALHDSGSGRPRVGIARDFLAANMPDADLRTRKAVVDGKIMFQVLSRLETPVLAMLGKPETHIVVSAHMPDGASDGAGRFMPSTYTSGQLRALRRQLDRMIADAPPRYRDHYRREYDRYYDRLSRNRQTR